ncbi:hypothetical protein ACGFZQ_48080 [Streptomyces sp. NPDC048254]|uniref:hypothetical protein n=1 Tax=Streptomyces sp. NPDC048254 TaxID=3365525 RepID=UPI003722B26B
MDTATVFGLFEVSSALHLWHHGVESAVASAFYRDAAMLMLDEPTSAMDPRAEYLVIGRFKELAAGKTAIFVTQGLENTQSLGVRPVALTTCSG